MARQNSINLAVRNFVDEIQNPHTRMNFNSDLRSFEDYQGPITGKETRKDLIAYVRHLTEQGLIASTVRGRIIRLRKVFEHLLNAGLIKLNPVSIEIAPKDKDLRRPKCPDLQELQRIFKALHFATFEDTRDALCVALMFFEAMRVQEVTMLKWENLHSVNGKYLLDFNGKNGRRDSVFLFPQTEQVMNKYISMLDQKPKKGPIIFSARNPDKHLTTRAIRKRIDLVFGRADVRKGLSCHSLRHCHAVVLASRGYPLTGVQRRLRHSSPMTSLKYYFHDDVSHYPHTQTQPEKLLDFKPGR